MYKADLGLVFGQKLDSVYRRLGTGIPEGFEETRVAEERWLFEIEEWKEIGEWIDSLEGQLP